MAIIQDYYISFQKYLTVPGLYFHPVSIFISFSWMHMFSLSMQARRAEMLPINERLLATHSIQ